MKTKTKNPYLRYMIEKFEHRKDKEEKIVNWYYNRMMKKTEIETLFYKENYE